MRAASCAKSGLSTGLYRLMLRYAPKRVTRDIRLVHERLVATGRARWLGSAATPAIRRPLLDLERAVARVQALLGDMVPDTLAAFSRAA